MSSNNYYLLDDMEKNIPNSNRELHENTSVEVLKNILKEYYQNHLPVDLLSWSRVNEPSDEMIYKEGYWNQIIFIRDTINGLLQKTYELYEQNPVMVISTHRSKSIVLPVYQINLKQYGMTMIVRNNFYDWKISVISDKDLNVDFKGVFKENKKAIPSVYCEGFSNDQVFGRYTDNKKNFTIEINNQNNLYVFMFLLRDYLNSIKD